MATATRTTVWSDNQTLTATALNGEFNHLLDAIAITNADIEAGAGIVYSKLSLTGSIVNADISAAAAIDPAKLAGTPTGSGNFVLQTSPTITTPVLNKPTVNGSVQAVTGVTTNLDCSTSNIFTITLGASTTFTISNVSTGQIFMLECKQGSGTTYTTTFWAGITWVTSGATAPTMTTTSNGYTTYGFRCTGTNTYLGYLVGTS